MKKEQVQQLIKDNIKLPEGVDMEKVEINYDAISENINSATNDVVKSESARASEKAQKDLLKKHGFESEEDFEKALKKEPEGEDKIEKLSSELETLKADIQEKDNIIKSREQKDVLKSLNIKDNHLDRAHKLITSELGEEDDFEEKAKAFIEDVPEWVAQKNDPKNLGSDKDGESGSDVKSETDIFRDAFSEK